MTTALVGYRPVARNPAADDLVRVVGSRYDGPICPHHDRAVALVPAAQCPECDGRLFDLDDGYWCPVCDYCCGC